MTPSIKIFNNAEFGEVRIFDKNGEPWFVGRDVCNILGYANSSDALAKRVDTEDKGVANCDTLGGNQNLTIINESGLYSLILSSKLPNAKRFKHWVTSEILPSIRKHGMYATDELINNPDVFIQVLQELKAERERKAALEAQAEANRPKIIFADAVAASHNSILIGDLAKLIKQNGVDIGQKRLFEWLRNNGYLMKSGASYNLPTQKSMELKLFEIKERTINNPDGSIRTTKTTKVTGKGQQYFINKLLSTTLLKS
ncbi:phage antirepressor KilAC domain-containing protein [uncultured Eubacterium sp.]|uniref:phage antirepressor KilAC domain-containing protein n=1 Tax=uncultured Eubacterium sp. TaxID=165185 RepID=UPI00262AE0D3|nr:phage antirepressor KilAC domain-containing protein [uncultured Eubacterium sp.]